jgi:Endosomal/lysosomal potassium channel TMEM175
LANPPAERRVFRLRGHEVSRLEAFSDAVFGFAATLLVVSLEVPQTYPELMQSLRGFVGFGLSFTVLLMMWVAHNGFFRRYGLQDGWTVAINSLLLFLVLFYVYPLKFLFTSLVDRFLGIESEGGIRSVAELRSVMLIYGLGFVAVFVCLVLLYLHAWRRRDELELDELERHEARMWTATT